VRIHAVRVQPDECSKCSSHLRRSLVDLLIRSSARARQLQLMQAARTATLSLSLRNTVPCRTPLPHPTGTASREERGDAGHAAPGAAALHAEAAAAGCTDGRRRGAVCPLHWGGGGFVGQGRSNRPFKVACLRAESCTGRAQGVHRACTERAESLHRATDTGCCTTLAAPQEGVGRTPAGAGGAQPAA